MTMCGCEGQGFRTTSLRDPDDVQGGLGDDQSPTTECWMLLLSMATDGSQGDKGINVCMAGMSNGIGLEGNTLQFFVFYM